MMLEQKSSLPFADNFPVHVQVSIFSNGGEYTAYISADMGMAYRFPIRLKPHDLKDLNAELQQAIEWVASSFGVESAYNDALSKLAQTGNFAFKRIFPEGPPREKIRSALKTGTIVQIASEDFFVPWELLYDGPLDARANISYYWGMYHIVSRTIVQDVRPGDFVPSVIQASRPRVGLVAYDELEYVAKQEIPVLRKLHRNKQIRLSRLQSLDTSRRDKELEGFGRFLRQNLQIVHLACHAYEMQPMHQSYLLISNKFPISIEDFFVREYEIKGNPFVILNACLTSVINPLYTSNWAAEFWKRGARGVLATDFHVPDWFAAAFTEELYQHLLSGKPIGEALLATRHHFWEKQRNPLGLAYALYSSPSIRIANSN